MDDLLKLKHLINYEFKNHALLLEAMTHRSYAAENNIDYDNQRLEYLGDAVLEIILSEYLYRTYPASTEGDLTRMRAALVQQEALACVARQIGLDRLSGWAKANWIQEARNAKRLFVMYSKPWPAQFISIPDCRPAPNCCCR